MITVEKPLFYLRILLIDLIRLFDSEYQWLTWNKN